MAVRFGVIFITDNYIIKKINYGLPFGIIFIAGNSDNPIDIDNKTKKLESCFRDAIKHPFYCPFTIGNYLILDNLKSCFVFQNKPNVTLFDNDENDRPFNLKQYLLGLKEKLGFELMGIFYCENSNTHKIELIGNNSDFREVLLEFSENIPKSPNGIPQFLTNDENAFLELENDKTINDLNLQDLWEKLKTQAFPLSDIITNAINQKEGVALNYALINDIKYNLLDNTFHILSLILICT